MAFEQICDKFNGRCLDAQSVHGNPRGQSPLKKELKLSSQELINMRSSQWTPQTYPIKQHADGRILTGQVRGQTREGFGIHQTGDGWSVTHLKSGWATFISGTEEGAKFITDYLIGSYADEFERLVINGCAVKNFRSLAGRIEADEALWNLRRLYATPQRELNRRRSEPQPKLEVFS
ncbi:MAG: hypothetical protein ACR2L1_01150 [Pyrinomonadaceae bacterium]